MMAISVHPRSDAWLLHAILNASRDEAAERSKIVAVADYYNHAVLTSEELEGGLKRLIETGWVSREGCTFYGTQKALQVYEAIEHRKLTCYEEMNRLKLRLEESLK
jgi:hypothetical protein